MTLRTEFEPLLLSPYGLHRDTTNCRIAWDRERSEAMLSEEVARAEQWLSLWPKTRAINKDVPTSYGLKHRASAWWREHNPGCGDGYIMNGCFLMAAHRLGFRMEGSLSRYCWFDSTSVWDTLNAWLNIDRACTDAAFKVTRAAPSLLPLAHRPAGA